MTCAVLGGASSNNIAMVNSYSYFSTGYVGFLLYHLCGPGVDSTYVISDLNSSAAVSALNGSTTRSVWALSTPAKLTSVLVCPPAAGSDHQLDQRRLRRHDHGNRDLFGSL